MSPPPPPPAQQPPPLSSSDLEDNDRKRSINEILTIVGSSEQEEPNVDDGFSQELFSRTTNSNNNNNFMLDSDDDDDSIIQEDLTDPRGPDDRDDTMLYASGDEPSIDYDDHDDEVDNNATYSDDPFTNTNNNNNNNNTSSSSSFFIPATVQQREDTNQYIANSLTASQVLPHTERILTSDIGINAAAASASLSSSSLVPMTPTTNISTIHFPATSLASPNTNTNTHHNPLLASEISYTGNDASETGIDVERTFSGTGTSANAANIKMSSINLEDATLTELETIGYGLQEIVAEPRFKRRIARDYQRFLTTFTDDAGQSVYHSRIRSMCAANKESLEVSYLHLVESNAFLAKLVANVPMATLAIFDEATMRIVLRLFEEYDSIRGEIHVRITDFPTMDQLRDLRYNHLGSLIRVRGVVTRRSGVFPQLKLVKLDCGKCGAVLGPFTQDNNVSLGGVGGTSTSTTTTSTGEIKLNRCGECDSRGPFTVNSSQTIYRNYQKLTLQETPGSVPAGRLPRHKEVIMLWDLIDYARPGEEVEVTGVYRNNFSYHLNSKNGFPVFSTMIEANWIVPVGSSSTSSGSRGGSSRLTEEDERECRKLSEDPMIGQRIVSSIAPSIYGHRNIKLAIALALFGGQGKNAQGKHPIRGDINCLLLGDPGCAKSQFLKYVEKTASRAVYTTGQGASAVGLTASVRKDPVTREWSLEGGALVLADRGVCLIDEFDKMNDADRTSIHEAMEQQSISISKAGIITSLQARCAIIAAANPIRGRYNSSLPFGQNVNLTEPILSRFDILCVVRDRVDAVEDERLANFVIGSHIRSHPSPTLSSTSLADSLQESTLSSSDNNNNAKPLDQLMLQKYITYAKCHVHPQLNEVDVDKIARLYSELRRESLASGSIPITVRHIESMVRMAEANARIHLRDQVRSDDIDLSIKVMLESFIQAQKYSVMSHLRRAFGKYISTKKEHSELLQFALQELTSTKKAYQRQNGIVSDEIEIPLSEFESRARELNVFDVRPFIKNRGLLVRNSKIILKR